MHSDNESPKEQPVRKPATKEAGELQLSGSLSKANFNRKQTFIQGDQEYGLYNAEFHTYNKRPKVKEFHYQYKKFKKEQIKNISQYFKYSFAIVVSYFPENRRLNKLNFDLVIMDCSEEKLKKLASDLNEGKNPEETKIQDIIAKAQEKIKQYYEDEISHTCDLMQKILKYNNLIDENNKIKDLNQAEIRYLLEKKLPEYFRIRVYKKIFYNIKNLEDLNAEKINEFIAYLNLIVTGNIAVTEKDGFYDPQEDKYEEVQRFTQEQINNIKSKMKEPAGIKKSLQEAYSVYKKFYEKELLNQFSSLEIEGMVLANTLDVNLYYGKKQVKKVNFISPILSFQNNLNSCPFNLVLEPNKRDFISKKKFNARKEACSILGKVKLKVFTSTSSHELVLYRSAALAFLKLYADLTNQTLPLLSAEFTEQLLPVKHLGSEFNSAERNKREIILIRAESQLEFKKLVRDNTENNDTAKTSLQSEQPLISRDEIDTVYQKLIPRLLKYSDDQGALIEYVLQAKVLHNLVSAIKHSGKPVEELLKIKRSLQNMNIDIKKAEDYDSLSYTEDLVFLQTSLEQHELKIQEEDNQDSGEHAEISFIRKDTLGGGDCLFHALLGTWNESSREYRCDDVVQKRKFVAEQIRNCKQDSPLFKLIQENIKALIMQASDEKLGEEGHELYREYIGKTFEQERERYKNTLKKDHDTLLVSQDEFYSSVQESVLLDKAHEFLSTHKTDENWKAWNERIKIDYFFNEYPNIESIIAEFPEVKAARNKYTDNSNSTYSWQEVYTNPDIINEYADYIAKEGNWLIPSELDMLARIFKLAVGYRTRNEDKGESKREIYNPDAPASVEVYFNGTDHYERMESDVSIANSSTKQNSKPPGIVLSEADFDYLENVAGMTALAKDQNKPSIKPAEKNNTTNNRVSANSFDYQDKDDQNKQESIPRPKTHTFPPDIVDLGDNQHFYSSDNEEDYLLESENADNFQDFGDMSLGGFISKEKQEEIIDALNNLAQKAEREIKVIKDFKSAKSKSDEKALAKSKSDEKALAQNQLKVLQNDLVAEYNTIIAPLLIRPSTSAKEFLIHKAKEQKKTIEAKIENELNQIELDFINELNQIELNSMLNSIMEEAGVLLKRGKGIATDIESEVKKIEDSISNSLAIPAGLTQNFKENQDRLSYLEQRLGKESKDVAYNLREKLLSLSSQNSVQKNELGRINAKVHEKFNETLLVIRDTKDRIIHLMSWDIIYSKIHEPIKVNSKWSKEENKKALTVFKNQIENVLQVAPQWLLPKSGYPQMAEGLARLSQFLKEKDPENTTKWKEDIIKISKDLYHQYVFLTENQNRINRQEIPVELTTYVVANSDLALKFDSRFLNQNRSFEEVLCGFLCISPIAEPKDMVAVRNIFEGIRSRAEKYEQTHPGLIDRIEKLISEQVNKYDEFPYMAKLYRYITFNLNSFYREVAEEKDLLKVCDIIKRFQEDILDHNLPLAKRSFSEEEYAILAEIFAKSYKKHKENPNSKPRALKYFEETVNECAATFFVNIQPDEMKIQPGLAQIEPEAILEQLKFDEVMKEAVKIRYAWLSRKGEMSADDSGENNWKAALVALFKGQALTRQQVQCIRDKWEKATHLSKEQKIHLLNYLASIKQAIKKIRNDHKKEIKADQSLSDNWDMLYEEIEDLAFKIDQFTVFNQDQQNVFLNDLAQFDRSFQTLLDLLYLENILNDEQKQSLLNDQNKQIGLFGSEMELLPGINAKKRENLTNFFLIFLQFVPPSGSIGKSTGLSYKGNIRSLRFLFDEKTWGEIEVCATERYDVVQHALMRSYANELFGLDQLDKNVALADKRIGRLLERSKMIRRFADQSLSAEIFNPEAKSKKPKGLEDGAKESTPLLSKDKDLVKVAQWCRYFESTIVIIAYYAQRLDSKTLLEQKLSQILSYGNKLFNIAEPEYIVAVDRNQLINDLNKAYSSLLESMRDGLLRKEADKLKLEEEIRAFLEGLSKNVADKDEIKEIIEEIVEINQSRSQLSEVEVLSIIDQIKFFLERRLIADFIAALSEPDFNELIRAREERAKLLKKILVAAILVVVGGGATGLVIYLWPRKHAPVILPPPSNYYIYTSFKDGNVTIASNRPGFSSGDVIDCADGMFPAISLSDLNVNATTIEVMRTISEINIPIEFIGSGNGGDVLSFSASFVATHASAYSNTGIIHFSVNQNFFWDYDADNVTFSHSGGFMPGLEVHFFLNSIPGIDVNNLPPSCTWNATENTLTFIEAVPGDTFSVPKNPNGGTLASSRAIYPWLADVSFRILPNATQNLDDSIEVTDQGIVDKDPQATAMLVSEIYEKAVAVASGSAYVNEQERPALIRAASAYNTVAPFAQPALTGGLQGSLPASSGESATHAIAVGAGLAGTVALGMVMVPIIKRVAATFGYYWGAQQSQANENDPAAKV